MTDPSGYGPYRSSTLPPEYEPGPEQTPPRPLRITPKLVLGVVAALVAIVVVSSGVGVWASSASRPAVLPAEWTAPANASASAERHVSLPVATGDRPTGAASTSSVPTTTPTGTATSKVAPTGANRTLPACKSGGTASGATWTMKAPVGWTCMSGTTTNSLAVVAIYRAQGDMISVTLAESSTAAAACSTELADFAVVEPQKDTIWGGRPAKTANATAGFVIAQARCVDWKGSVYIVVGIPAEGSVDTIVAAMDTFTASWVWK